MLIYKKQAVFRSIIVFIVLSIVFLFTVEGISSNYSVISRDIVILLKNNWAIVFIGFLTAIWIWSYRPYSRHIFILFWLIISLKSFILLYGSFNKLVIIFNFVYLFFGFYFYNSLEAFVKSAANVPNYSTFDIKCDGRFKIQGRLDLKNGKEHLDCFLTNLDNQSCFIMPKEKQKIKMGKRYSVSFILEDVEFTSEVLAVSTYGEDGLGFVFNEDKDLRSLSGLYKVCLDRSIF